MRDRLAAALVGAHADMPLAERAVELGFLSAEQLQACLEEFERRTAKGPLLDELVRQGALTPDQLAQLRALAPTEDTIGRFRILRLIARGGMATVYEALDPQLGRRVALKVLREARAGMLQRLQREAVTAAKLRHSNIVAVHDVGSVRDSGGESQFIVMDYVDGTTLAAALPHMSRRRRIEALRTVARAVAYAHERGVLHRDLKPHNVLVDAAGGIFLTDFGLAKVVDGEDLTRTGTVLGTPVYMAPEQAAGRTHEVDARSDVYALGVILYEALTGRVPFGGSTAVEVFRRIVEEEPPPLKDVPPDLAIVCFKTLEKDRQRRYATAGAFADDLDHWLAGEPIVARPPSVAYRLARLVRRRRAAAAAAALLATGLALGTMLIAERRAAREREAALKELGALWGAVLVAKHDLYIAGEAPGRVRRRIGTEIERVSAFIARHPKRPEAYYVRARGRLFLDELAEAEDDLRRAIALNSSFAPAHALLGRVLLEESNHMLYGIPQTWHDRLREASGRLREAEQRLRQGYEGDFEEWGLVRTREDDVTDTLTRALLLWYVRGDHDAAARLLADANARDPSEEYMNQLGRWAATIEERLQWQSMALARRPHFAAASRDRGELRMVRRDFAAAAQDFTDALAVSPRSVTAYTSRGRALREWGDTEGALRDFDAALAIDGASPAARLSRAHTRASRGDTDGAIADWTYLIEQTPPLAPQGHYDCGTARMTRREFEAAVRHFTTAIELAPRYAQAFTNRGCARYQMGDLDGAIADYDSALAVDPREAQAHFNRGLAWRTKGDRVAAIRDFTAAITLEPHRAEALSYRALARKEQGDLQGAAADYEAALTVAPADWPYRDVVREHLRALGH